MIASQIFKIIEWKNRVFVCDDRCKTVAMSILLHQNVIIDSCHYRLWMRFFVLNVFDTFRVDWLIFLFFDTLLLLPDIDISFRVDVKHAPLNLQSPWYDFLLTLEPLLYGPHPLILFLLKVDLMLILHDDSFGIVEEERVWVVGDLYEVA